jgi:hypothetical protein
MELISSWEATSRSATREFPKVMEPESLLLCSQEPSSGPYPESDESSPYNPILPL